MSMTLMRGIIAGIVVTDNISATYLNRVEPTRRSRVDLIRKTSSNRSATHCQIDDALELPSVHKEGVSCVSYSQPYVQLAVSTVFMVMCLLK
jgi:hypothetical protein